MSEQWVWDIKIQCQEQEVAFFFKQWGGKNKKKAGRKLAGMTYDEMPIQEIIKIMFSSETIAKTGIPMK